VGRGDRRQFKDNLLMERSGAGPRLIIVRGLPGQPIHQNESEMQKRWLAPFEMTAWWAMGAR
jgi:hypothetical protein